MSEIKATENFYDYGSWLYWLRQLVVLGVINVGDYQPNLLIAIP